MKIIFAVMSLVSMSISAYAGFPSSCRSQLKAGKITGEQTLNDRLRAKGIGHNLVPERDLVKYLRDLTAAYANPRSNDDPGNGQYAQREAMVFRFLLHTVGMNTIFSNGKERSTLYMHIGLLGVVPIDSGDSRMRTAMQNSMKKYTGFTFYGGLGDGNYAATFTGTDSFGRKRRINVEFKGIEDNGQTYFGVSSIRDSSDGFFGMFSSDEPTGGHYEGKRELVEFVSEEGWS